MSRAPAATMRCSFAEHDTYLVSLSFVAVLLGVLFCLAGGSYLTTEDHGKRYKEHLSEHRVGSRELSRMQEVHAQACRRAPLTPKRRINTKTYARTPDRVSVTDGSKVQRMRTRPHTATAGAPLTAPRQNGMEGSAQVGRQHRSRALEQAIHAPQKRRPCTISQGHSCGFGDARSTTTGRQKYTRDKTNGLIVL
jgi:hypothetical protein